jgi:uncharacterized protein (TIGR02246 family)
MRFHRFHLLALALGLLLASLGCQTAPSPEQQAAAATAAIGALRDQFVSSFNSNDPAALAALYTEDAVLMPNHEPDVDGRDAIQSWYEARFKEASAKIAIAPEETQVAGDWAYDRGSATVSVTPKAGGAPMEDSGKYIVILKRVAGVWKVHRDIDNSNNPMPAVPTGKK